LTWTRIKAAAYLDRVEALLGWETVKDVEVDLTDFTSPSALIELVPEFIALEQLVLPLGETTAGLLVLATPNVHDGEVLESVRFVSNREIHCVTTPREQVVEAIYRHYSTYETESLGSMIREFTDTAIDFSDETSTE
jgi:type IV pilus assembly protein PilB